MVAKSSTKSVRLKPNSYFANTYPISVLVTITARVMITVIRILLINQLAISFLKASGIL